MPQVNTTTAPLTSQVRDHWFAAGSALLALLATTAVVLVLATGGGSTSAPVAQSAQPTARAYGGPDESAVAAAVGRASQPATAGRPDESGVAAAVGSANGRAHAGTGKGQIKVSPTIRHN